jgi:hypothetical protein
VKVLGMLTTAVVAALVVSAVVVGARSIPDVKRYMGMRRM